ncbi:TetR/AcrR family transcriptional regulator [Chitinophaga pinensis]|uniref:Transcriptional regulator, TetR family n=1 Tax=Chitinophaga pinensis (strain ATCC 43595 / DSM 2588 / LMG 13176 / NBRC 15968 / NCIMB 11800 / UQM 2034) TaxID=485918 RepID=A0A979G5C0_CHIPD|nr:TetR/AcrR family transcriptional regulator [Chitinophaga pinensis]ACU60958.1 transcriptional regulator, TetR family [Chitinophaga pinensis DSM 2588]
MPLKNTGTEQLIKDTAKQLLFAEGKLHATTQEIADAAGVNRTALHYYFRSRDQLIAAVFQDAMQGLSQRLDECMLSETSFREKTANIIAVFLKDMIAFPYQETFLITEINTFGKKLITNIQSEPVKSYLKEASDEMEKGSIDKMEPIHFLMNLFSLMSYPLIMAPLYKKLFRVSEKEFQRLINERETLIMNMLFKS